MPTFTIIIIIRTYLEHCNLRRTGTGTDPPDNDAPPNECVVITAAAAAGNLTATKHDFAIAVIKTITYLSSECFPIRKVFHF